MEVEKNLLTEFMNSSDRRREAGKPENALESWKEASLILHVEPLEEISGGEEDKEKKKKEKKEK